MSDGELGSEAVDVVEVAVRRVLVLLLEFCSVKRLVVKSLSRGSSSRSSSRGASLCVEGTVGSCRLGSRRGSSSGFGLFSLLCLCEVFCDAGSSESLGGVRAHFDVSGGGVGEDTLVVVHVCDLCAASDASVSRDDLTGADLEGGAHDGAAGGLLCEPGDGGVGGGCGGEEGAEGGGVCAPEEGAGSFEFCE